MKGGEKRWGREDEEEEVKVRGKERKRRKKESGKTRGGEIAG